MIWWIVDTFWVVPICDLFKDRCMDGVIIDNNLLPCPIKQIDFMLQGLKLRLCGVHLWIKISPIYSLAYKWIIFNSLESYLLLVDVVLSEKSCKIQFKCCVTFIIDFLLRNLLQVHFFRNYIVRCSWNFEEIFVSNFWFW